VDVIDLLFAILHHFLVFTLAGLLAAELALVRPGLSGASLNLLGRIDAAYGGVAMAIVVVGICRVIFGLRGWDYYVSNHAFWGKMACFVVVGLLSIRPTMRIIAWRRSGTGAVPEGEVNAVRGWIRGEIFFLALVLVFAAMMARW
jgi:putative membrane protein